MRFPNAAKGVKRIFTAELIKLFGSLCGIAGIVIIAIGVVETVLSSEIKVNDAKALVEAIIADAFGTFLGGLILIVAWVVLSIVAFVLHLVGIINAKNDEISFKSALTCLIIELIAPVIAGIFVNVNSVVSSLFYTFAHLMGLFVTLFIISGCIKLADKLNRGDVSAKGSNVLKLIFVIAALSLVLNVVSTVMMTGTAVFVTAMILFAAALVLIVIQYIMFLSFLSKAKKMLAES